MNDKISTQEETDNDANEPVEPRFFCYEVETCGCCWHYYLWRYKFGFGKKDGSPYIELFGKTFWWYQFAGRFKKNED